jgi:hypothetical protein
MGFPNLLKVSPIGSPGSSNPCVQEVLKTQKGSFTSHVGRQHKGEVNSCVLPINHTFKAESVSLHLPSPVGFEKNCSTVQKFHGGTVAKSLSCSANHSPSMCMLIAQQTENPNKDTSEFSGKHLSL